MSEFYKYDACGLDYIFLQNGYEKHDTSYGEGVSIKDVDDLHNAIVRSIILGEHAIRGQELRFLRSWLKLSQKAIGALIGGRSRSSVATWEGKRRSASIDGGCDRALRMICARKMLNCEVIDEIIAICDKIDEDQYGKAVFVDTDNGWNRMAA